MRKEAAKHALLNSDEFNEKYINYIEKGFEGLCINDIDVIKYLDNVFEDLIKIEGFKYSQIKLKFGMVRFHAENISGEMCFALEDKIADILRQKMRKN